jgi:hypothetical protein
MWGILSWLDRDSGLGAVRRGFRVSNPSLGPLVLIPAYETNVGRGGGNRP